MVLPTEKFLFVFVAQALWLLIFKTFVQCCQVFICVSRSRDELGGFEFISDSSLHKQATKIIPPDSNLHQFSGMDFLSSFSERCRIKDIDTLSFI